MMKKDDIVILSKNTKRGIILDKINALGTKLELTDEMIHKTSISIKRLRK